ncbi:MAG: hypothetical protein PQJ61_00640 [Spirochaetales bacterium]|uniref:Uncharacterized protein n=1 Tax=Candidatus Thalassospirochaeta sargassi TaxID=3119039 RepID=A0AAJ1I9N3_9SPIO|nr:hypothetical protein [Spirochaetales bacterium]
MGSAALDAGYEEEACPTADAIGTCSSYTTLDEADVNYVFYESYGSASTAETVCDYAGGTWTAAR